MRILLMGTFTLLAGCAGGLSNFETFASLSATVPRGFNLVQDYSGEYTCPQGLTSVNLRVLTNPNSPDVKFAVFSFGPPGTDLRKDPQGSYLMSGTFDLDSGFVSFQPISWLRKPLFFTMVGMTGYSEDGGISFVGKIESPGCGSFQIRNDASSYSLSKSTWFSAAPQLQPQTILTVKKALAGANIVITPDVFKVYIKHYMKTVAPDGNPDAPGAIEDFIEAAEPLREKGLTISQAIYYSANGMAYGDISRFNASKKLYEAEKNSVLQRCGGNINNNEITQMSPYAARGQCFKIYSTRVSQWIDQGSALVSNYGLYLDFPDSQQTNEFNDVIVVGEAPYTYQAASGAVLTIPRAQVLMHIEESLEIPDPPGPDG